MSTVKKLGFFIFVAACVLGVSPVMAEEAVAESEASETAFHCEVLKLQGEVNTADAEGASKKLSEGDLLKVGQLVEVGADSYVDLAFDREWKNISRIEEKSKIKIEKIYPGKLELKQGSIYAKLKDLPKGSSFEVRTPTAVATVRGSEYRTVVQEGETEVFNSADSPIYVYGVDASGVVNKKDLVVLKESQKTSVDKPGFPPASPLDMTAEELDVVTKTTTHIETHVTEVRKSGRISQIQSVEELEKIKLEGEDERHSTTAVPTEDSRVDDGRRRPFKKTN